MKYSNKEVIAILKENIRLTKQYLKGKHTKGFIDETNGLISGYEFAIIVLKKDIA